MTRWMLIRRLRGPAFLILFGITLCLHQWGILSLGRSWPLYLILAGVLLLAERAAKPPLYSPQAAASAPHRYWRRPSIVGPVALIIFGIIALLVELGRLNAFAVWGWYLRWWPLLLIAIGLISLGEWWLDRDHPYSRRHGHGAVVVLLLLLALFGYAGRGLRFWGVFGNRDDGLLFHPFSHEYDADRSLSQEIPTGALVDIRAPQGNVTVTPSGDNQIHVQAHEVVYAGNDAESRRAFEALEPQLVVSGKNVVLHPAKRNRGRADWTVELPPGATAAIRAGYGNVDVNGLNTPVMVTANHGDVRLENVTAPVDARLRQGGFTARAISGDISLEGRLEDVTISDVKGRVSLDGDFFGDMYVANITSQVHFHSTRTTIELASLPGDLTLNSGELAVDNASGPIAIATRAKDVACTRITGNVHIEDRDGGISLSPVGQPGTTSIEDYNGEIHLTVLPNTNFALQATARNGEIHSEFNLPITSVGAGHSTSGVVGSGGAKTELIADHGDIRISKANLAATSGMSTKLVQSGKAIRHLRPPQSGVPRSQMQ